jgi:hypothetical protein
LRRVGLYPGFVEAIRELQADGAQPLILTDISEQAAIWIRDYLAELGLGDIELVRCLGKEKAQWCVDHNVSVLIDDAPHTLADAVERGIATASFPYQYNADALAAHPVESAPAGDWPAMLASVRATLAGQAAAAELADAVAASKPSRREHCSGSGSLVRGIFHLGTKATCTVCGRTVGTRHFSKLTSSARLVAHNLPAA